MVRFGVIGAGSIARVFCEAVRGVQGNLYAVASRDQKRSDELKDAYGFEKAYDSYEKLLSDPLVDCVYLATPHGLHYEQMMMILDYKKHILCEKSFTLNAKQAAAVFKKAKENNLFVMEAMWTRFLPTIKEVLVSVKNKMIGDITHLENSFGFSFENRDQSRLFDPKLGAGALLDIGVYSVTMAHLFLGNPSHFDTEVILDPRGFDLSESITFHYPDLDAHMSCSLESILDNECIITGTKGVIKIPQFWRAEKAYIYDLNHQLIKEIAHPHPINGFEFEILEVIKCIESGLTESSTMTHQTTLDIMKLMDGLRYAWGLKYPQE